MDTSILIVLAILVATVVMLVFNVARMDVIAIVCMLALGWTGVLEPQEMLSGFSSNAVIAMISVMIMGRGVARTGIMDRFSRQVVKIAGNDRKKVVTLMSMGVGMVSGFVQNVGTAALFLPGILDVSRRTRIPASALVMPVGFAIILGGLLTMVGSGHLILVNDLLPGAGLEPFRLFSILPFGLLLLIAGIALFYFFGNYFLPVGKDERVISEQEKMIASLRLPQNIWHYSVSATSPLIGKTTEEAGIWDKFNVNILGTYGDMGMIYAPWRETRFKAGQEIAIMGTDQNMKRFADEFVLVPEPLSVRFARLHDPTESGFAEVIVPPRSDAIGQSIRKFSMRRRFAVEPVRLFSKGEEMRGDFSDRKLGPGDTIIVYGLWDKIKDLKESVDFVVATPFETEIKDKTKTFAALFSFLFAVGLTLAGYPISMAFFTGAMVMVFARVLNIQQAYNAVEWKVVFLIAGLIPLGIAMQKTGTASFLAFELMQMVPEKNTYMLIFAIALLSTVLSLFISNFGAVVVLTPLVISMASIAGIDPRPLVLMAAICAGNAFILPTQQVNALMMSSGGYRNLDYIRAGGAMTAIFLLIVVVTFSVSYTLW
jgi:di/tricarboxylate transporter